MTKCKGFTKSGQPCKMDAGKDGWCFNHRPGAEAEAERQTARSTGGKVGKAATLSPEDVKVSFDSAQSVTALLASVTEWVLTGRIDPKVANAAVYASSAALRSLDVGEFEERLKQLEAQLDVKGAA